MTEPSARVVLHITESFGAGTATAILQFAAAVPEADHHLLRRVREDSTAAVPADVLASVSDLPSGFAAALLEIRRTVKRLRPDIVHCHSSIGGALTRLAIRSSARRPTVYSPHCYAFQRRDVSRAVRSVYCAIEWGLSWNTAVVATCSPHESRLARSLNPVTRVQHVPNARPERHGRTERSAARTVVTTGRIGPQKDPSFFLRVVEETRKVDPSVRFTWLGAGPDSAVRRLQASGVHVTGWTHRPWEDVADDSVYLHSAQWEGFPFAVLEAHSRGLPLLVRAIPSFSGGPPEWISSSPRELAERLTRLVRSDAERTRNHGAWGRALSDNDRAHQRAALSRIYRVAAGGGTE